MVLLGELQARSGESQGGNRRSYGLGLPGLPHRQRSALPSPKRWRQTSSLCSLPCHCIMLPGLLTKIKIDSTSAWFTELCAVTAGEWSYLSVPLPFCHRDRRPWCWGRANSSSSILSSCLLVKPQRWWIRALVGRWSRFLGFITATSSESLPVTESWLFSDHPVLSESVGWSQILRKPRSERRGWTRLWRKNCPKTADGSHAQH